MNPLLTKTIKFLKPIFTSLIMQNVPILIFSIRAKQAQINLEIKVQGKINEIKEPLISLDETENPFK